MDFSELIGFLISLFAFIFLMYRRATARRRGTSQDEEKEQQKRLREFLRSLDVEMEGDEEEEPVRLPPPAPPAPRPAPPQTTPAPQAHTYSFGSRMDSYQQHATRQYQENDYHMIIKEKPSRGKRLLASLRSPKEMIILSEILAKRY